MMTNFFPIIEMKGDSYDMGLSHGRGLATEIQANLKLYFSMFQELNGFTPDHCLTHAGRYRDIIKEDAPTLLEEMKGIASGAGVSLEEIVFLNARSELMSMTWRSETTVAECTAIGLAGQRTTSGRPILAQNWDWHERVSETSAVFLLKPSQGPRALYLAEAGQVAKIGVNEHGVGVTLNILIIEEVGHGLPVHVLLRLVLGARDTSEAIARVKDARKGGASHFLIADPNDQMAGLELTPVKVGEISPENGVVLHTNHYCNPQLVKKDLGPLLLPCSVPRYDRAAALISGRKQWDAESLVEIFKDHENGPSSICRHVDVCSPKHLRMMTVASCIIDLAGRKMLISGGQPCRAPYREVSL
jgi:isopenicillin-N N-acyltransferase-like protein